MGPQIEGALWGAISRAQNSQAVREMPRRGPSRREASPHDQAARKPCARFPVYGDITARPCTSVTALPHRETCHWLRDCSGRISTPDGRVPRRDRRSRHSGERRPGITEDPLAETCSGSREMWRGRRGAPVQPRRIAPRPPGPRGRPRGRHGGRYRGESSKPLGPRPHVRQCNAPTHR